MHLLYKTRFINMLTIKLFVLQVDLSSKLGVAEEAQSLGPLKILFTMLFQRRFALSR